MYVLLAIDMTIYIMQYRESYTERLYFPPDSSGKPLPCEVIRSWCAHHQPPPPTTTHPLKVFARPF